MSQEDLNKPRIVTVLAIDDEETVAKLYQNLIVDMGYQLIVAKTGAEAIDKIRQQYFDLVILDLELPDIHGSDLLKHIYEKLGGVPVIIITGHPSLESSIDAIRTGRVYDYIIKPFNSNDLKMIVQRAVEKAFLMNENKRLLMRLEVSNRALRERVEQLEKISLMSVDYERTINELKERIRQIERN